ncbi:MAG: transposase [Pseudonocardiaceae bacterium]
MDGIFYWLTNRVPWSRVPSRYGESQTLYNRRFRYKNNGVFRRMYRDLQDKPEAKRIVEWLRELDSDARL